MNTLHNFDEVFDTQRVFRKLLEAMSNPGRIVSVSEEKDRLFGDFPSFLAVAMTLIDNEVSFSAAGNKELKQDRKSTRLNSSHDRQSRMPSSA